MSQTLRALSLGRCLGIAVLAWGCNGRGVEARHVARGMDAEAAAATITADDMLARIGTLAHDSMRGRDTPSPGLEKAAAYLAGVFRELGLEPGGENGTFLQRYPLPLRALDTTGVHFGTVNGAGEDNRMLAYGTDFFASPAAMREGVDMFHGRFTWVGDLSGGLPAAEYGPRTLLVVSVPGGPSRDWRLAVSAAQRAAMQAGATALFVILGTEFNADTVNRMAASYARPRRALVDPGEIPAFYVTQDAWRGILEREGRLAAELLAAPPAPIVFENVRAHFAAVAKVVEEGSPPNVVAILRGDDPELRDTYVVFSAHMDHVGVGTADAAGDSIFNGADDNASGSSALAEVAQAFAALRDPPRRSLVFLAVSGEEKGLLGSRWFTDHPTIPLDAIVADINVDMIGRNSRDSIAVIGQEYSSLGPLVRSVAAEHPALGLTVSEDLWPQERFFFRSDHFNFARHEIPALFFFAGTHEDYHRPSDQVEKIDGEKAARVARLVFYTAHRIAESTEPPRWTAEGLAEIRALTR